MKNYHFKAVFIESDKQKFSDLLVTQKKFSNIVAINKHVDFKRKSKNTLDNILNNTKISKKFEVLSIDIDSFDLAVWRSLKKYRPKIVIIEINSGIKPGKKQLHSVNKQGNSFTSTVNFAKANGYELVCHTGNCIFVEKKYIRKIGINKRYLENPEILFDYSWFYYKDSLIKKIAKKLLPNSFKNSLKKFINLF